LRHVSPRDQFVVWLSWGLEVHSNLDSHVDTDQPRDIECIGIIGSQIRVVDIGYRLECPSVGGSSSRGRLECRDKF
jgi:hypothetical protein